MAGGSWSPTDKPKVPGFYMNFVSAALASIQPGARGVVVIPVKAPWGPVNQFVEITSESSLIENYTNSTQNGASAYTAIRMALLGGAKKVLGYRLADSSKAVSTLSLADSNATPTSVVRLETLYPTGRAFSVAVAVNPVDAAKKDIKLYEGTALLHTFTLTSGTVDAVVSAVNNDTGNKWLRAVKLNEGTGILADLSAVALIGGNSGIAGVTAADYAAFLAACETQEFNLLVLDGVSDGAIQTSVRSWVARVRDGGKMVMAVLGGSAADDAATDAVSKAVARSAGFNHEGIVNVGAGAILDGVSHSSAMVACFVAGLIGGQKLSEATTYAATPFDDVTRRWTPGKEGEQAAAISNGVFLLIHDGRFVKVLSGVNTLVSLREGQSNAFKKIRAIRVMDAINTDLQREAEDNYIGKVNNTEAGRLALIGAFEQYMKTHAQAGTIENNGWAVYLNPDYYGKNATLVPAADEVYTKWEANVTDVMEKIYGEFIVK